MSKELINVTDMAFNLLIKHKIITKEEFKQAMAEDEDGYDGFKSLLKSKMDEARNADKN